LRRTDKHAFLAFEKVFKQRIPQTKKTKGSIMPIVEKKKIYSKPAKPIS